MLTNDELRDKIHDIVCGDGERSASTALDRLIEQSIDSDFDFNVQEAKQIIAEMIGG
jgi:hypothetical protein